MANPAAGSLEFEIPQIPEPVEDDLNVNGYERISSLEIELHELRIILNQLYKHMTEGTDINLKVRTVREGEKVAEEKEVETRTN